MHRKAVTKAFNGKGTNKVLHQRNIFMNIYKFKEQQLIYTLSVHIFKNTYNIIQVMHTLLIWDVSTTPDKHILKLSLERWNVVFDRQIFISGAMCANRERSLQLTRCTFWRAQRPPSPKAFIYWKWHRTGSPLEILEKAVKGINQGIIRKFVFLIIYRFTSYLFVENFAA